MNLKQRLTSALLALALAAAAAGSASPDDPARVKPLEVGAAAPAFSAREADGQPFLFQPKKLSKPTMLIFYRGGWCPYCNAHLKDLRTAVPQVSALGFEVLFLSTDRPEILRSSLNETVDYHLLSDNEVNAARAFGVAFRMDDATYAKYKTYGLDLEETQGATHHELPVPAVFIVDRMGNIRFAHTNADYKQRLPAADVVKAAQAAIR
ncbi:MAG TPA: peroxiredoxin-like family protein [Steroidobacteraceae bacterium]|nr:peroxiredoxin-like family protein [Steroidobacteraceae bacterium]